MKEPIEITLAKLEEEGLIERVWNEKEKTFYYKLTEEGVKKVERKLKSSVDYLWFYWTLVYEQEKDKKDFFQILNDFMIFTISRLNRNFLPIFLYSVEKGWVKGITLEGPAKELAKELAKLNKKELMRICMVRK
ncbi:MAG: hypothetical protein OH338_05130 [Candidatus Parvarchaeota archaeon]|nr:hypothetical protein [Candidatus Parvarchaeum tengchongense]